jgi:PAS domain S-box-containing protein
LPLAKILLVEEEPATAKHIQHSLEKLGFSVAGISNNGVDAILLSKKVEFDLVLMDLSIKGAFSGIETAKKITSSNEVPVVYLSGSKEKDTTETVKGVKSYGYLLKPLNENDLNSCLRSALMRFDAEKKVKESEERFNALTEVALSSIIIIEGNKFIYANAHTESLTGYSSRELLNMNFWDIVHPDFMDLVKERGLARQRGEQVPNAYEFKILTKSGDEKWVQTSATLTDFEGRICTLAIVFDITDRKATEQNLRQSEERYRAFIEQSTEGIYRAEARNPISTKIPVEQQVKAMFNELYTAECNDVMARMYGLDSALDLIGRDIKDFLLPDDSGNLKMMRDFVSNNYRIVDAESHEVDSSGNEVYFSNNAVGIIENEKLVRIWGLQRDITTRKKIEHKLNENVEYATIINYFTSSMMKQNTVDQILWDVSQNCFSKLSFVDCAIYLVDETGKMLLQKAAYGRKNPSGEGITNPLHLPVGKGVVGSVAASGKAEIISDTSKDSRYMVDDELRYSEIAVPIINEGKVIGVIDSEHPEKNFFTEFHLNILMSIASLCSNKIVQAMAQEKIIKSEERYRTFIEQSSEGIFRLEFKKPIPIAMLLEEQIDMIGKNIYIAECNDVFARMYGEEQSENLIGKNTSELKYVNINEKERTRKFIEQNYNTFEEETIEKDKQGNLFYFINNAAGVIEDGHLTRVWGVQRDITEKKKADEALKHSLKEKEILLKEIHHRVKNNLQIVTSLLKLQSSYVDDDKVKQLFKESQNRVQSMSLIHQKLYQSKDLSHINFKDYIETVVLHLQHSYGMLEDKVKIIIDVKDIAMPIDNAVPAGLIINELISNSLKHAFPGGRTGEIFIHLAYDEFKKEYWLIIRDTGIGIPKGFDYKNANTFGLKLVTTLIGQMGGTMELASYGGSEYRITFKSSDYKERN